MKNSELIDLDVHKNPNKYKLSVNRIAVSKISNNASCTSGSHSIMSTVSESNSDYTENSKKGKINKIIPFIDKHINEEKLEEITNS